jgi:Zn-dependent protease
MADAPDPFGDPSDPRLQRPDRAEIVIPPAPRADGSIPIPPPEIPGAPPPPRGGYDTSRDWSKPPEGYDTSRDWSKPPEAAAPAEREQQDGSETQGWLKRILGPLAGVGVLISKLALLLKIPLLGTVITVFASLVGYALLFGWTFGFIVVASIFVHELGHVIQTRREGLKVHGMMFIPFFGAYVSHEITESVEESGRIAVAGPVAGTLVAAALFFVDSGSPMLQAAAFFGFYINLLNLIPVSFLDGKRATAMFSSLWWAGTVVVLVPVALLSHNILVWIIILFGVMGAYSRRHQGWGLQPRPVEDAPDNGVSLTNRATAVCVYVLVVAVCALGGRATFVDRSGELGSTFRGAVQTQQRSTTASVGSGTVASVAAAPNVHRSSDAG